MGNEEQVTGPALSYGFAVPLDTKQVISETFFPANLLASSKKLNLTQQQQTLIRNTRIMQHDINTKSKARLGRLVRRPPTWKRSMQALF